MPHLSVTACDPICVTLKMDLNAKVLWEHW